ncbi:MAG: 16S rRNA (guanine(966)-N(2))-methyltransferase RsmD [Lachnospiraceae bacterium]|nr:16S rRNA (guanine(966)-N(2))-methyltransferase RsmD [Lachnospiraceae bacterium]MDD3794831.1 16S rRNA (guanine(966)-N(2))-methyltransferase RsmD [Lachnospiraceae bacterium]
MRVIAGSARRLPLKTIEGLDTRPTTDRIKETLFNILQDELYDCRFLDLFAGSGSIGIEALSRGAREAVFVENNRRAVSCIQENLEFTKLASLGKVISGDVLSALNRLNGQEPFHIIFMDPPYGHLWEKRVLEVLADSSIVDEDTLLIAEASLDTDFSYLDELGYEVRRRKEYKTNTHMFLRRV